MCHQITYTLPCEHVRVQLIYCGNATPATSSSGSGKGKSSSSSKSPSSKSGGASSSNSKTKSRHPGSSSASLSSTPSGPERKPCKNLTQQALPYPTPPSFAASPSSAAGSPLLPKCPLERCPFEEKNRCWNCCWCGKSWNEKGRCSCVMIIDGQKLPCGHICCGTCEAAWQPAGE